MAWTANYLDSWARDDGRIVARVVYSDGTTKVVLEHILESLDGLADAARAQASRLEAATAAKSKFILQPGALIDLTPASATPAPTPEDQSKQAFVDDLRKLRQYRKALDLGLISADDKNLTDLAAALKGEWLDAYLNFL